MSGSKRIEWIDVAKGVGIVLVSFGHLRNGDGEAAVAARTWTRPSTHIACSICPCSSYWGAHVQ